MKFLTIYFLLSQNRLERSLSECSDDLSTSTGMSPIPAAQSPRLSLNEGILVLCVHNKNIASPQLMFICMYV